MKGRLFLSGGGNEKQTETLDEIFLEKIKKILYIPLAWPNEDFESCLNWFKNLLKIHKKETKIEMLTELGKKIELKDYNAIYIGGGNTFKLLKKIKESNFDKKLINYYNSGGTIYGGSAGAIIFGKNIKIALICKDKDINKVNLADTSGLNQLEEAEIQCHFEDNQIKEHKNYLEKNNIKKIICIPEESALIVSGNSKKVIGLKPITVITKKDIKKYKVGELIK